MADRPERWLIAAWPGLGRVATTAAVYLLSKLRMHQVGEFRARDLFDLENVDVKGGLLRAARLPRSRLFLSSSASRRCDILVFLGEAQPLSGKLALCQRLITESRTLGVTRVFAFSALVTEMNPGSPSRTFAVASDTASLDELKRHEVSLLKEGQIGGLNGLVLAAAAEAGLPAVGLLGEMPAVAPHLPYPSASAAVLRVFKELSGLALDLGELEEYGRAMQAQLFAIYQRVIQALQESAQSDETDSEAAAGGQPESHAQTPPRETALAAEDAGRIELLFRQARVDRSKAFALKKELDRLGVFARYEDRFLNLFEPNR
ncbi:MAG TPA: hypothetical protein DEB40_08565 [Elusimicrobia bacterium]|nr:hypothetical protein [Elusimicrobiota bacterium]HBT61780.1 hypothetical protein [Elusimicrobiota bacterium]